MGRQSFNEKYPEKVQIIKKLRSKTPPTPYEEIARRLDISSRTAWEYGRAEHNTEISWEQIDEVFHLLFAKLPPEQQEEVQQNEKVRNLAKKLREVL